MGELSPSGGGRGRIEVMVILIKYQQVIFPIPVIPSHEGRGNRLSTRLSLFINS
jgi:hypothetical protein